jgi:prophage regulatory protein
MQTKPSESNTERLLRLPAVMAIVGLQKSSIYDGVRNGTFPAPIKLSRRAVCWPESHVAAWVTERIQQTYNFEA